MFRGDLNVLFDYTYSFLPDMGLNHRCIVKVVTERLRTENPV